MAAGEAEQMTIFSSTEAQARFAGDGLFSGWRSLELAAGSHLFVAVTIRGTKISAVIDSGAARSVIDRQVANKLQIPTRAGFIAKGVGGTAHGEFADHVAMQIGDLELSGLEAGVLDLSMLSVAMGMRVDLVIGRELFELALVDLDFSNRRIGFYSPDHSPELSDAVAIPLVDDGRGRKSIPLSLGSGGTVMACYDLGSDVPLLISPAFASERKLLAGLRLSSVASAGVGGMGIGTVAILPKISVGGLSLANVPVQVPATWSQTVQILVGLPIWSRFRNVINFSRSRLSLCADHNSISAPFAKDRSGIGATRSNGRLQVIHVSERSPAWAAGLRTGDDIVEIDGHAVDIAYLTSHPRIGERPAGTLVTLTLLDGRKVQFQLADYY